jgi:glycosyltransferase involved in cell wall biosynthesis
MNILYDGQIYALNPTGGICRYFTKLISKLPTNFIPSLITCQDFTINIHYPTHPNLKIYKRLNFRSSRISYWLEKPYLRAVSTLGRFELAHPTYYSLFTQQKIDQYRCPVVLTVYDMVYEIFRNKIDPTGEHVGLKKKAILSAQKLICISENTKKDLINWYSVPEEKIIVTYLAAGIDASLSHGDEPVPSRPYYLYVGSRDSSYKNFDTLLLAFENVVSINAEIVLCVVGYPFSETEIKRIAELKLTERIEHYTYASDSHLAKLYRCSVAFVYPSFYEGFGIPPLEAMSCGTPVIASNCSSIPEVVGDAGLLFNPNSVSELTDILLFLFDNSIERDRLIAKGLQRAKAFSWDKTVAQTLDVYYSLVK